MLQPRLLKINVLLRNYDIFTILKQLGSGKIIQGNKTHAYTCMHNYKILAYTYHTIC